MEILSNNTLGEIVSQFPKASDIFQKYQIDYCCGGHRELLDAAAEAGVNVEMLIEELKSYYTKNNVSSNNWLQAPIDDLVHHILQAHHAYLYEVLPVLSELTTKIVRVHGSHHPELSVVFQAFHQLKSDMTLHLIQEETVQYPAIEAYVESGHIQDLEKAVGVIADLEEDHTAVGNLLKKMREVTKHYLLPDDACTTFQKTYYLLQDLEQNTFTHIHLENNILFGRLKQLLN